MKIPANHILWITQVLDGEREHCAEFEAMLDAHPECRMMFEQQKNLVGLLSRTVVPSPPESINDDIMAMVMAKGAHRANERAVQQAPSLLESIWDACLDYIPVFELPTTLRREACAVCLVLVAVLWGTLIGPQVQSGQAQGYLVPIRTNVISLADELQEQSRQIPAQLRSMTTQLIESASSTFRMSDESTVDESDSARLDSLKRFTETQTIPNGSTA